MRQRCCVGARRSDGHAVIGYRPAHVLHLWSYGHGVFWQDLFSFHARQMLGVHALDGRTDGARSPAEGGPCRGGSSYKADALDLLVPSCPAYGGRLAGGAAGYERMSDGRSEQIRRRTGQQRPRAWAKPQRLSAERPGAERWPWAAVLMYQAFVPLPVSVRLGSVAERDMESV